MLLPLITTALAYPAAEDMAPCGEPYIVGTVPTAGQTEVPLDISPALIWAEDCGDGGVLNARLELDGQVLAEQQFVTEVGSNGMERLLLEEPLLPGTDYLFVIEDSWSSVEIAFTTGEGLVVGAEPPVAISTEASTWADGDGFALWTSVEAEFGQDPDHSSVLLLVDADGGILAASSNNPSWMTAREHVSERPEEGCTLLAQEDGAGTRSEPIEACAEATLVGGGHPDRLGCSTGGLAATLGMALAGLLALRRRD